ncbi:MAG: PAS domain-containing protein, partial [Hyphomicrobiales bacterium]|nr:PAS domain-containing protein [Hyphomicrobiales bacterium]
MKNHADSHLLMALESTKVCVWRWSASTGTIVYNPENAGKVIGLPSESLPRSDEETLALIHPEDQSRVAEVFQRANEDGSNYEIEYRLIGPDQSITYIHETSQPEFDQAGQFIGNFGTWQNITERRRADEALRESERRLQAAAKMAKLGYFMWDLVKDRCVYCSEEYARIHGMSVEEYMTIVTTLESDSQWVHPDDRERFMAALKRSMERDETFELEYRILGEDGQVRHVREKEIFCEAKDGVYLMTEGTLQDITDIRQAEERLRRAQKMEAIGQLTGGLAHDFNNLLAVIQGNAELLARGAEMSDPRLQAIIRSTKRGGELTQRLLAFSRQQPLHPQSVDLAALMERISALLGPTLGEAIEIVTEHPSDLWFVLADPGQLEDALLNLAINARDAMPRGGKLTIECGNASPEEVHAAQNFGTVAGDYVVIAVSDTGEGMSDAVRERAFEPFFTTKEVGKGSGLGLSMVYGFAKQSGGHVTIDSELERGTTVRLF